MRRGKPGQSERLAEIVDRVLGPMSLEAAAIKLNQELSHQTIARLKKGITGLEATVRTFADGFWDRICDHYGDEVRQRYEECTSRTAADWLVEEAGFREPRRSTRVPDEGADEEPFSGGAKGGVARLSAEARAKWAQLPPAERDRLEAMQTALAESFLLGWNPD